MKTTQILWALTVVVFCHCATAQELARANFGATHYPIWSELTYFERSALGDLPKARDNQADALLALYLIASGVRELGDYETVNRRIKAFTGTLEEKLGSEESAKRIGEAINTEMHAAFFLKESNSKAPSGYAPDQSRLMGIFETGEFNCISSAMLYAVLARQFDLKVQGVLLPSHAFVQLHTPGGEIDIETTSPQGFAQIHNEAFYQKQSTEWHELRGLTPATYDDYLQRQRVTPTVLAAKNMLNQHTAKEEMNLADSARLAEISAYIYPSNALAQEKRLYFYNRELQDLAKLDAWTSLVRMYQSTYDQVLEDAELLGYPSSIVEPLVYYQLGAMVAYGHAADTNATLDTLEDILVRHPSIPAKQKEVEGQIVHAINVLAGELVDQALFEEALMVLPVAQIQLPSHPAWPKITRWIYLRWVEYFWQQKQWQDVIYTAEEWLSQPMLDANDDKAMEIVGSAYQQLVVTALQNNEIETAQMHVEMCTGTHSASVCAKANKSVSQFKTKLRAQR